MAESGKPEKTTIALLSGDFDKALAAFNIATAAATMGGGVTIFFTFWGLNVIRKKRPSSRAKGLMRKLLRRMNKGGAERLKLSRFNMWGIGTWMMKLLMKAGNMPDVVQMIRMAKDLGVRFVACTTTMALMGISREDLIDEVDDLAGATAYVDEAMDSRVNLFI